MSKNKPTEPITTKFTRGEFALLVSVLQDEMNSDRATINLRYYHMLLDLRNRLEIIANAGPLSTDIVTVTNQ